MLLWSPDDFNMEKKMKQKRKPQDAVVANVARLRKEVRELQRVVKRLVKQVKKR